MKKKNRPEKQAANSDIRTSDITPTTSPVQVPKRTPKKHRARVYMLRTGFEGWTENDILRYCRLSSGRNYAREGANKQVISSQADSLIKISRIWADFFPANTSNQPV